MVLVHDAWRETTESEAVERVETQSVGSLDEVDRVKLEEMLVRRTIQGDSDALVMLYEKYLEPVYAYFYRRVGSVAEAEDLTQETFTRAIEALTRGLYEWQGKLFGAWLSGIAVRVFREWRRGLQTRSLTEGLDDLLVHYEPESEEPDPLDSLVQSEERTALWQLVRELPVEEQNLLILRHVDGLPYAEIARRLGRSAHACKQLHYRALKRLRLATRESQI